MVKNLPPSAGNVSDENLIPGWGRSLGGGHGNPLQYSCLENPLVRGAWWATALGSQRIRCNLACTHTGALCLMGDMKEMKQIQEKSDKGDEGDLKSCHIEENWKKWDFFPQRR